MSYKGLEHGVRYPLRETRPWGASHPGGLSRFPNRRGYVLMMVLVLLIVLATTLTSIANRSLQTTQEAIMAVTQLQQRIGMESCRKAILPKADFVFKKLDGLRRSGRDLGTPEASRMASAAISLGSQRFDLVLFDENAKVNLNTVNHLDGQEKVQQLLRKSLPIATSRTIAFHPSSVASRSPSRATEPSKSSKDRQKSSASSSNPNAAESEVSSSPPVIPAFRSWGEIFDFGMLIGQNPAKQVQLDFTKDFTLWGSGQINIHRAADSQIAMLMETVVTSAEAKSILAKLREFPDASIDLILEKELKRPDDRKLLKGLIGTASFAYSLFVDVETPQCRSRKFFVNSIDTNGVQQILEFVFH